MAYKPKPSTFGLVSAPMSAKSRTARALQAAVGPAALLPAVEWGPDWGLGDQVEVHLHLVRLFQVRDVLGDGTLLKTRLRDGTGQFPVDCPIEDCCVRLHYSARLPGSPGPAAFDLSLIHI